MVANAENSDHEGKKWQQVINGFFTCPAISIFGMLLVRQVEYAMLLFVMFGLLLAASCVHRVFNQLPKLTRILIATSPILFVFGWILGNANVETVIVVFLIGAYALLGVVSNLGIPKAFKPRDSTGAT
ncbi:MAG TPA: hypothetical protein VF275_01850 [Gammaproteobacteria bacterium]